MLSASDMASDEGRGRATTDTEGSGRRAGRRPQLGAHHPHDSRSRR